MSKSLKISSDSSELTKKIGTEFAKKIINLSRNRRARVVTLKGDLGAGKTTFVLGFLKYFGIKPRAASPTFVIMKRYKPKSQIANRKLRIGSIYHLDAYRLHSKKDLGVLGFEEVLQNPKNLVLIEWPEKIKGAKFKNKIAVRFDYGKQENERTISFIN